MDSETHGTSQGSDSDFSGEYEGIKTNIYCKQAVLITGRSVNIAKVNPLKLQRALKIPSTKFI